MKHGIILTSGDPRVAADLAAAAEAAGWDGVFTWDGVAIGAMDTFDPWVTMAAMAMRTDRVRIGAVVTPPARRRPWKLARETMTLDRLSNGRLVLPVGLGATDDGAFGNVGEATDARTRAERLDEALQILEGLWSGEPFAFQGQHHRFAPMTFRPTPVQAPRIPIWVVGAWPHERSMRRAARWDGVLIQAEVPSGAPGVTADVVTEIVRWGHHERAAQGLAGAWDVVVAGVTPDDPAAAGRELTPLAEAGATWWIESDWSDGTPERLAARIAAGPPVHRTTAATGPT